MSFIYTKCPGCYELTLVDDTKTYDFCERCGNQVLITNSMRIGDANERIKYYTSDIKSNNEKIAALRRSIPLREKKWTSIPKRMIVIAGLAIALIIFIVIVVAPSPIWRQLIAPLAIGVAVGLAICGYQARKFYRQEKTSLEWDRKQLADTEEKLASDQQSLAEQRQRLAKYMAQR